MKTHWRGTAPTWLPQNRRRRRIAMRMQALGREFEPGNCHSSIVNCHLSSYGCAFGAASLGNNCAKRYSHGDFPAEFQEIVFAVQRT
jgi:hypothetical protein